MQKTTQCEFEFMDEDEDWLFYLIRVEIDLFCF